jgi:hypothetical protein
MPGEVHPAVTHLAIAGEGFSVFITLSTLWGMCSNTSHTSGG